MRARGILIACATALVFATPALAAPPHLAPSDRRSIDETLDVFVNHAVKRKNVGAAYDFVTPTLKGGMTRAQFARGEIGVYPYPAAGRKFHEWNIQYRTRDEVAIELILSPTKRYQGKLGQILFHVYLQPSHGKWLVDEFMPGATFAPIGKPGVVQAARDFQANPSAQTYNRGKNRVTGPTRPPKLSSDLAFVPFAVIGLVLAGLAGWGVVGRIRHRRVLAEYDRGIGT